jgi:hypothetical protein
MHAMFHDECHPDVSLSDWQAFRDWHSPASASGVPHCRAIEEVLDRNAVRLPPWYLPLARGAAIASLYLAHRAGYRPGGHRARGWVMCKPKPYREQELFKDLGRDGLIVTRCKPFWRITIGRGVLSRPHPDFALVHMFGSTPILTRTYQEATYLAELCYEKGSPGLCWVHECPDDMNDAIDFALNRRIAETRAAHRSSVAYAQRLPLAGP